MSGSREHNPIDLEMTTDRDLREDLDILLINPPFKGHKFLPTVPPLGLNSVGVYTEKSGYSVSILDLGFEKSSFDLFNYLKSKKPKLVGIGGTSATRFAAFEIARIVKSACPSTYVVYGGCHATFTPADTLNSIQDIDFIVRGDGELPFVALLDVILKGSGDIKGVNGISHRAKGKIIHNPDQNQLVDLDSFPVHRELLKNERYFWKNPPSPKIWTALTTSRGCPFRCYFCAASEMFINYNACSPKKIVDEMKYLVDRLGVGGFRFFDSTFTIKRDRVVSFVEEMKARDFHVDWECTIHASTVDEELLQIMHQGGCKMVNCGLETASPEVLKRIRKGTSLEQIIRVLKWSRKIGLNTRVFFSFGHPEETFEEAMETVQFLRENISYIDIPTITWGIQIFPGTRAEKYAIKKGTLPADFSWSRPLDDSIYKDDLALVPFLQGHTLRPQDMAVLRKRLAWPLRWKVLQEIAGHYRFKNLRYFSFKLLLADISAVFRGGIEVLFGKKVKRTP